MAQDLLPSSVPKILRSRVFKDGQPWVPIYCANCGCDGGWVPEVSIEDTNFAFYLCDPCAIKWEPLAGHMLVPDEAFWAKVNQAQLETYGRVLEPHEIVEELKNGDSILSKLARQRFNPGSHL